jgi:hypothetical protein
MARGGAVLSIKLKCRICRSRDALSATVQMCEVCAYAAAVGRAAADRQVELAERDAERRKREREKARGKEA